MTDFPHRTAASLEAALRRLGDRPSPLQRLRDALGAQRHPRRRAPSEAETARREQEAFHASDPLL